MTVKFVASKRSALTIPSKLVKNRPPLLSNVELARELGITNHALGLMMGHSKAPTPMPQLSSGSNSGGRQMYYNAKELRAWLAAYQKTKGESNAKQD